ncbi:short-chain collagen C4-like [Saccostrea echinata]|uniref:short-chain collagen C4-like n=1 Tax=Saccostrea echinata TaxID=191078 RepID=UPI002A807AE7|nr:short-chain collagen C4-like [Saccostrea echinata]
MPIPKRNKYEYVIRTTYTIWGKRTCPQLNNTKTVYSGIVAGSFYSETGNGANTLCLPHDPDSIDAHFPIHGDGGLAHLYGGEYQFSLKNVDYQEDAPCAICHVTAATSAIMIPGKLTCPVGWVKQYQGFLTSNSYTEQKSEYLCLDDNPDFFERSGANENGKLFYPVVTVCGTLPCPPYKNGTYVPCSLCTL